jgi:geranylgeranyl diphosphate synthase type II
MSMPLPDFEAYRAKIEEELALISLPQQPASLYEPVRYILALGGKRLRPVLTLLSCELFGGVVDQALPAALAVEVFHNFTLVHDDIMDNANLRRGRPTVHTQWNMPTAILSGDVMLVKAYELLMAQEDYYIHPSLLIFNDAAKKVCEGQQLDMEYEHAQQVSIEQYLHMTGLKTGALLAASLTLGALIGNAAPQDAMSMYDVGHNLGLAFQLQDDYLDAFGNNKFGKTIGGDIAANKKTFLTLKALEIAPPAVREHLLMLCSQEDMPRDKKISEVLEIYRSLGIPAETGKLIDFYFNAALQALDNIRVMPEKKQRLRNLASSLMNRDN